MATCAACGSADQFGRYCSNCGGVVAAGAAGPPPATVQESALSDPALPSDPTVSLQKGPGPDYPGGAGAGPGQFGPAAGITGAPPPGQPGVAPGGFGSPPPLQFGMPETYQGQSTQNYPPYLPEVAPFPSGPATGGRGGRWKGWAIAGAAFVVVIALATTAVLVLRQSDSASDETPGTAPATSTAAPPPSSMDIKAPDRGVVPPGGRSADDPSAEATTAPVNPTPAAAPPAAAPSTTAPPAAINPLASPQQGIACGGGYIVQVASELDQAALSRRVEQLQAAGQLPAGTKWTDTDSSCAIFTSQINVFVVYAGPYATPYDACPARLASPPDAFIKGTTPETSKDYVSCLCPTPVTGLPAITTEGQQGVWVGELQRVLGARLDYDIGNINADPASGNPGSWGIYTPQTAAAVGRFQAAGGLPATNQVDVSTWSALQSQSC